MPFAYSLGFYDDDHELDSASESVEGDEDEQQRPELTAWKQDLAKGLKAIQYFGDFATQRTYSQFVNSGLEIADSLIPLPLISLFADQIKAVLRPPPLRQRGRNCRGPFRPPNMGAQQS